MQKKIYWHKISFAEKFAGQVTANVDVSGCPAVHEDEMEEFRARVLCRATRGRRSTPTELDENVACQLHVVLGKVQSPHGAVLVEAFADELAHVRVCDAREEV